MRTFPGKIGCLEPVTGKITEYPLPNPKCLPRDMILGRDDNLWFSENQSNTIGRITPDGKISKFPLPRGCRPVGLATASDGNIWYAAQQQRIGRLNLKSVGN